MEGFIFSIVHASGEQKKTKNVASISGIVFSERGFFMYEAMKVVDERDSPILFATCLKTLRLTFKERND